MHQFGIVESRKLNAQAVHGRRIGLARTLEIRRGGRRGARRQPAQQGAEQRAGLHRLGDEIVHAGFQTAVAIFREGVGGHGQNRHLPAVRQAPDHARGFEAVHDGHLHIHQDQFVMLAASQFLYRIDPVSGKRDIQPDAFQHAGGNLLVGGVVLHDQYPCAPIVARQPCFRLGGRDRRGIQGSGGLVAPWPAKARGEPEAAAGAFGAFDAAFSAHQFGQVPGDGQTQPGATETPRGRGVGLLERGEQARPDVGRDADAGILDLESEEDAVLVLRCQGRTQGHVSMPGELHGIVGKIEQSLRDPRRIAEDGGQAAIRLDAHLDPLGARLFAQHRGDVGKDAGQRDGQGFEPELPGLDL